MDCDIETKLIDSVDIGSLTTEELASYTEMFLKSKPNE